MTIYKRELVVEMEITADENSQPKVKAGLKKVIGRLKNKVAGKGNGSNGSNGSDGSGSDGDDKGANANTMIIYMYALICALVFLCIITIFILNTTDIVRMNYGDANQQISYKIDPHILNKDTIEYYCVKYMKTKSIKNEPYSVFKGEYLLATAYILISLAISGFIFHLAAMFMYYVWLMYKNRTKDMLSMQPFIDNKIVLVLLVLLSICVIVLDSFYRSQYVGGVSKSLQLNNENIANLNNYIYNSLSKNTAFLKALRENNFDGMVDAFNAADDPNLSKDNIPTLEQKNMISSLTMFSYFQENIPQSSPDFVKVTSMILNPVASKNFDFSGYFYFHNAPPITAIWPIFSSGSACENGTRTNIQSASDIVADRSNVLNDYVLKLHNLGQSKKQLTLYFYYLAIVSLIIIAIVSAVSFSSLSPPAQATVVQNANAAAQPVIAAAENVKYTTLQIIQKISVLVGLKK